MKALSRILTIENFGPIKNANIDIDKNITVLIGAQASGKSTISKVIYFCLKIKDYLYDYINDSSNFNEKHPNEYITGFRKYLRTRFIGIFGKTTHMKNFRIVYTFESEEISIYLGKDRYVFFNFSNGLKTKIDNTINDYATIFLKMGDSTLRDFLNELKTIKMVKSMLAKTINDAFRDSRDIIYIPAGRSLLATLSEKLSDFTLNDIDLTMRDFIELIESTRRNFGSKIPEIVENYLKTIKGQIKNAAIDKAYELIKKILRADYVSDSEGEKVYFDETHWVHLMFASSGQQESLWILMLLFLKILENKKTFFIIEEPEAHLFPVAQKYMAELIALCANSTGSNIFITTHSPYIMTSLNVLLYSNKIENNTAVKTSEPIIPKLCRLNFTEFAAFYIDNNDNDVQLTSLMDIETNMMRTDFIDSVSEITNDELGKLIDLEVKYDL